MSWSQGAAEPPSFPLGFFELPPDVLFASREAANAFCSLAVERETASEDDSFLPTPWMHSGPKVHQYFLRNISRPAPLLPSTLGLIFPCQKYYKSLLAALPGSWLSTIQVILKSRPHYSC